MDLVCQQYFNILYRSFRMLHQYVTFVLIESKVLPTCCWLRQTQDLHFFVSILMSASLYSSSYINGKELKKQKWHSLHRLIGSFGHFGAESRVSSKIHNIPVLYSKSRLYVDTVCIICFQLSMLST